MDLFQSFLTLCDKVSMTKSETLCCALWIMFFSGVLSGFLFHLLIKAVRTLKVHLQKPSK